MATQRVTPAEQETQATTNGTISQEERERIDRELAKLPTRAVEMDGVCPECYANVSCDCL
jgi:hypothetical protein